MYLWLAFQQLFEHILFVKTLFSNLYQESLQYQGSR